MDSSHSVIDIAAIGTLLRIEWVSLVFNAAAPDESRASSTKWAKKWLNADNSNNPFLCAVFCLPVRRRRKNEMNLLRTDHSPLLLDFVVAFYRPQWMRTFACLCADRHCWSYHSQLRDNGAWTLHFGRSRTSAASTCRSRRRPRCRRWRRQHYLTPECFLLERKLRTSMWCQYLMLVILNVCWRYWMDAMTLESLSVCW